MSPIYESRFYDFYYCTETNSLVFCWKPETVKITDQDFKEGLSNFAGYAFELGTPNLIIDITNSRMPAGTPSPEVMGRWRKKVIIPRYNKAGVKKFAFIKEPGTPGPEVGALPQGPEEEYETVVFDSKEKMAQWLTSRH